MIEKLKCCPFCGGKAGQRSGQGYSVYCRNQCTALEDLYFTPDVWNKRAQPTGEAEPVAWYRDTRRYHEYEGSAKEDTVGYMSREWWHMSPEWNPYKNEPPPDNEGWIPVCTAAPPAAANQAGIPEGWISVDERLPERGQDVLVSGHQYNDLSKPRFVCSATKLDGGFFDDAGDAIFTTHWMPLPAAPHTESHALGGGDE